MLTISTHVNKCVMKKLHHVTMMVLVFLHLGIKLILAKLLCSSTLMRKKKHCPITMREKCSNINYKIVNRKMISYKTFVLAHCHLTEFLYSIEIKKSTAREIIFKWCRPWVSNTRSAGCLWPAMLFGNFRITNVYLIYCSLFTGVLKCSVSE